MSVKDYAISQGIKTSAVYNRRERGRLDMVKVNGILLVDTESYVPGRCGRPKKGMGL